MNDIEREIEGIEEDDSIRMINRNRDNDRKKKIIIYVIVGILFLLLVGFGIFMFLGNDEDNNSNNNDDDTLVNGSGDSVKEEENESDYWYVSCNDNTSLLNVRNSPTGKIIDGLSCYKEVVVDDVLEGTDNCPSWYKISYTNKKKQKVTGYACASYIEKSEVSDKIFSDAKTLIYKVNDYYSDSLSGPVCWGSDPKKIINFSDGMTGEYVHSEFETLEKLREYLLSFMDEDLIDVKLELSDIDNPKYYDNYYEIDGSLYCRNYTDKGINSYYTGNYDIEVVSVKDDKITLNIAYEYVDNKSNCDIYEKEKCSRYDFVYEIGKIVIENNIVTKIDFHK